MDSYREFPSDFEPAYDAGDVQDSVTSAIGTDERRMHVRAYNYWASLLDGRDYPSIEDLEPGDLLDFAPNSVLLDFTAGRENPATPYVGTAIRAECDLAEEVLTIADVPSRSLLSRLTDHYMQIIANRAPVGFEAEFVNQRGDNIRYRGILMPFSSDGDTIDFIYGVINWKTVEESVSTAASPVPQPQVEAPEIDEVDEALDVVPFAAPETEEPLELVEPLAIESAEDEPLELTDAVPVATAVSLDSFEAADDDASEIELGDDAGLADRLSAARESAAAVKSAEGRSREALYRALARAYDFALASRQEPDDYVELLEESGMKAQARAPMTPIVKLVFGIDYDKARLTEYAAALSYAERQNVAFGGFLAFIEAQAGGLKALVAAERQARRPEPKPDTKTAKARETLRSARPVSLQDISSAEEFALVLTRRTAEGSHEAVAVIEDPSLVERAIRRAAA